MYLQIRWISLTVYPCVCVSKEQFVHFSYFKTQRRCPPLTTKKKKKKNQLMPSNCFLPSKQYLLFSSFWMGAMYLSSARRQHWAIIRGWMWGVERRGREREIWNSSVRYPKGIEVPWRFVPHSVIKERIKEEKTGREVNEKRDERKEKR